MSTESQTSFYNALISKIEALPEHGGYTVERLAQARTAFTVMSVGDASEAIDRAKTRLAKAQADYPAVKAEPVKPVVPSGHYALTVDGVVKFYRVNNVTEGKWAGYTFVDAQASDEYHKVGREASRVILTAIAADPLAALKLYGHSLGRCGVCRRTLTDEASRVAGIGPVCASRL